MFGGFIYLSYLCTCKQEVQPIKQKTIMDFNEFNEKITALRENLDLTKRQIENLKKEYGESHLEYPVGSKLRIEYPDGKTEEVYVSGYNVWWADGHINVYYCKVKKDGTMSSRLAYPRMWDNPKVTKIN